MRILVVTSCTKEKAVHDERQLSLEDFRDPLRFKKRESELAHLRRKAGQFYTGQQHILVMNGVCRLRECYGEDAVDVRIISAGYGLIPEDRLLVPYEVTFQKMKPREALEWARHLRIVKDLKGAMKDFPLVIFLLGEDYLRVVEPPLTPAYRQRLVFLAKPDRTDGLRNPGVTVIPTGESQRRKYGGNHIALKGKMFDLFSTALVSGGPPLWQAVCQDDSPTSFLHALAIGFANR